MIKQLILYIVLFLAVQVTAQNYPGPAGSSTTDAIQNDSPLISNWATGITVKRGFLDIQDTLFEISGNNKAFHGNPNNAIGYATGLVGDVVSLGDGGEAILTFDWPISDGNGVDFAVFENSFSDEFLELAFVEVSTDGEKYVRFSSHSQTQTLTQINGFGNLQASRLNNLAGKYRAGYGTPFDLNELQDSVGIDIQEIRYVKIVDVIGSISDSARYDAYNNKINDPYPTPYESGGFDLDGIAVINQTVGVDKEVAENGIHFYPNPTENQIQFNSEVESLMIYALIGELVYTSTNNSKFAFELPSGLYILKAMQGGNLFVETLIVH